MCDPTPVLYVRRDGMFVALPDAEFADIAREWARENPAEALRTLLFDECTEPDRFDGEDCPACDGSGKVLKDGVTIRPESEWAVYGHYVIVPASWLEGASDE